MKMIECKRYSIDDGVITIIPSGYEGVFIEVYEDPYYNLHVRYVTSDEVEKYDRVIDDEMF